jgi:hypothetical protein
MAALTETVVLSFIGRLVPLSFTEFVDARAGRLELEVVVRSSGIDRFTVEVSGQRDLVDAFEMACSLGPLDCLVLDCERVEIREIAEGKGKR